MPDVEMPNGDIVNFPDDMPKEQIRGLIASKFPETEKSALDKLKSAPGAAWEGIKQGASFGFGDEAQAGIAALTVGANNLINDSGISMGDAYNQALDELRDEQKQARKEHPIISGVGEIAGGLATGTTALNALRGANAAKQSGTVLAGAGRGIRDGLVSGALYGFGTGEGSTGNRLANSAASGAAGGVLGGVLGGAGAAISNSLASRAARLLEIKRSRQARISPELSGDSRPLNTSTNALSKVIERLRADYPDEEQFREALQRFQNGEATLGEIGADRTKDLALGAAQYPTGKAVTQEFFYGREPSMGQAPVGGALQSARDKVTKSIEKNISDADYYGTLDSIVEKGRAKAAPLYDKAYTQTVNSGSLNIPEVRNALDKARKTFPSELQDLPDNSVKVLDYTKRVLDDEINTAKRAGENNFARSRQEIKDKLISEIDQQSPEYKKARRVAGDYLSNKSAMEAGEKFKGNAKQIERDFKKLGETEKQSYRAGVVQHVKQMTDKVKDTGNVHSKVFGSPETRAKLKAVLSEKEYKQLETDMWASDRIYKYRDKVLGNSTTASKQISAQEFAANPILQDLAMGRPVNAGVNAATQWIKKQFDGLSDKTAGDVARILTARSDSERWKLIRQIEDFSDPKTAAAATGSRSLKTYYQIMDMVKPYRNAPGIASGNLASQPLRPEGGEYAPRAPDGSLLVTVPIGQ